MNKSPFSRLTAQTKESRISPRPERKEGTPRNEREEGRISPRKEMVRSPDFREFARNTSSNLTSTRKEINDYMNKKVTIKDILGVSETLKNADPRLLSSTCKEELSKLRELINNLLDYIYLTRISSKLANPGNL